MSDEDNPLVAPASFGVVSDELDAYFELEGD